MRYANLIPHSHIARAPDARLTADARRAFTRAKTDQREAHAWALALARRWRLVAAELSRPCALPD